MIDSSPYSLQASDSTSDRYHQDIATFADRWLAYTRATAARLVYDYRAYRRSEGLTGRSFDECGLELLVLGVLLREHGRQAAALPGWAAWLLARLVTLQGRWRQAERLFKAGRGLLGGAVHDTGIGYAGQAKVRADRLPPEPAAVALLVRWLLAHGETAQAERLAVWRDYCDTVGPEQARQVIRQSMALADDFALESRLALGRYTTGVEAYRATAAGRARFRYDAELLTRSRLEYHLGLLGTEVLNRAYRARFEAATHKLVIVPPCLRTPPEGSGCQAEQTSLGAMCRGCNPACRVHQLTKMGQQQGFMVYSIPDDELARVCVASGQAGSGGIGVVGLSCALTNWTAGWEAERLGLAAQGHLLDYAGCRCHWHTQGVPTDTNFKKLRQVVGAATLTGQLRRSI